uniref:Uncharacterized protein n=1 Tax=Aegilops tauschii subsp. strangulata TaxID=200361 RepID=A0A453CNQ5_AEGTS
MFFVILVEKSAAKFLNLHRCNRAKRFQLAWTKLATIYTRNEAIAPLICLFLPPCLL